MNNNDFKKRIKYTLPEQEEIENKFYSLIYEYEKNNSFENREFLCYLTSAIFLTYKKLFPQLKIYIPFRTKGDISYIQNIQKEFSNYIKGENKKNDKSWNIFDTIKDLSAIRIVLDDIDFSVPPNNDVFDLFEDKTIKRLYDKSQSNYRFIQKVDKFLKSPIKSGKEYITLRQELLQRITHPDVTPTQFKNERAPHRSFEELLDSTNRRIAYYNENPDEIPISVSSTDINTLGELLNDLRVRLYDQLQFAILDKTIPIVLSDSLITNALQTFYKEDKHRYKDNGFEGIYDNLFTPFGPVELISESNFGYYKDKRGSAYHSGMGNKAFNVEEFFELVDSNDKHPLSYYLDKLDSISADSLFSPYELPENKQEKSDFLKTPKGIAYLESEKCREMMKHIRIKDKMEVPTMQIRLGSYIKSEKSRLITVSTNDYLISSALSYSPYMNVCSASHTSYTSASIHHKKVIGEFVEILRKKDSNTCLRELLLRRLEQLIDDNLLIYNEPNQENKLSDGMKRSLEVVKIHDEIAHRLPKDISNKNIYLYAEKLRNMQNEKETESNLDL